MAFAILRSFVKTGSRLGGNSRMGLKPLNPYYNIRPYDAHPNCNEYIGAREVVGFGVNSEYYYIDHPAFPFPAIRFREDTPEILALREKEKGDWRSLTKEEKKILYRASFCQTYAEFTAYTGIWKSHVGFALMGVSLGIWLYFYIRCLYSTELPDTFCESRQKAQLQALLDMECNPITGLASKWDYENEKWK